MPQLNKILDNLIEYLNVSELKDLCFRLQISYDNLNDSTRNDKARKLVEYCHRHGLVDKLVQECRLI